MLYFKKNQPNNIVVTWTERSISDAAPFYLLVLTKLATLAEYSISLRKSDNLSYYRQRYDLFVINYPFAEEGQYKYIVYEANYTSPATFYQLYNERCDADGAFYSEAPQCAFDRFVPFSPPTPSIVSVVETGLAQVEMDEEAFARYGSDTAYTEYQTAANTFDETFDQTFD
jgi:hypothetical protein